MNANDLVSRLMQAHVAELLRKYRSNLAFAMKAVENKWLPDDGDPAIQQHLDALRQYLTGIGSSENDEFLLRLGLTVPGMQRGIVPPLMVLDANRGGFSPRRLREAEGQIGRLSEALTIGRQFVPTLNPDTRQALEELANLCEVQPVPSDTEWLKWFGELSPDLSAQVAKQAISYLSSDDSSIEEIGTQILQRLACFRHLPLSEECCLAIAEQGVFWPASLYRDSGDEVAKELLSWIDSPSESLSLNHLLLALAWTRSTAAQQAFQKWSAQSPSWASELHVPPEDYLPEAGWCLDGHGQRHDLISTTCYRLVPVEDTSLQDIPCRVQHSEPCPSCGGPRAWLFDFSALAKDSFPIEFAEAPRKILCCLHCACYGTVFTSYREDENGEWLSPNDPCEFEFSGDRKSCVRRLDLSPFPPFACAEPFALNDASTLGGIPSWLSDAEFPRCLRCHELMTFLAQHDNGSLGEEGIYYAFFCASCRVAAVNYQQT